jgi:hypothetical protein
MATNDELPWKTLGAVAEAASGFLDPLLSTMNPLARRVSYAPGTWDSELRRWR